MRRIATILTAATLLSGAAAAADAKTQYYIMGDPGVMTCATLSTKLNDEKAGVDLGVWLAGYITALNRTTPDTYNLIGGMEVTALFQGIIDHCAKTPTDLVETAAYTVLETTAYPSRKTTGP